MIHERALHEEVTDHGFPGQLHIAPWGTAMQQVGMPDQDVALTSVKILGLGPVLRDHALNVRFILLLIRAISLTLKFRFGNANVLAEHIGPAVTSWVEDERPAIGVDVLARDPSRREISQRISRHVDGIRMHPLL